MTRRIAFLTVSDARDRRNFSGVYYYMAKALAEHCGDVELLGPVDHRPVRFVTQQVSRILGKVTGHPYYWRHSVPYGMAVGARLRKVIARGTFDVIFCPTEIAAGSYIGTSVPIVYLSDATHAQLAGYYEGMSGMCSMSHLEQHYLTRRIFKRSQFLVFSSDWACQSAIQDYGAPAERTHRVSFGANTDFLPTREAVLNSSSDSCNLLFLGCDWPRKGGPIAYEAFKLLRDSGVDCRFTILGCHPAEVANDPRVTTIGYLNQNNETDRQQFTQLMKSTSVLLLPSRADCTPISFCDANAYGIPVVTSNTGGVASVITDGVNGFMLPLEAKAQAYADLIRRLWSDRPTFQKLRETSRDEFERRLNWDEWGQAIDRLLTAHKL